MRRGHVREPAGRERAMLVLRRGLLSTTHWRVDHRWVYKLPGGPLRGVFGIFWLCELRGGEIPIVHGCNILRWLRCGKLKRSMVCTISADTAEIANAICLQGQYSASSSASCKSCPAGTFAAFSAGLCTSCPVGRYSLTAGSAVSSSCRSCPSGTYQVKLLLRMRASFYRPISNSRNTPTIATHAQ